MKILGKRSMFTGAWLLMLWATAAPAQSHIDLYGDHGSHERQPAAPPHRNDAPVIVRAPSQRPKSDRWRRHYREPYNGLHDSSRRRRRHGPHGHWRHEHSTQPNRHDGSVIVEAPRHDRWRRRYYHEPYNRFGDSGRWHRRPGAPGHWRHRLNRGVQRFPSGPESRGTGTRPTYNGQLLGPSR